MDPFGPYFPWQLLAAKKKDTTFLETESYLFLWSIGINRLLDGWGQQILLKRCGIG